MGQYLQINGDYNIKTKVGGTITLDTGSELVNDELRYPGKVEVLGDLNVRGTTTTIASTDLELVDRILTLNKGETGPGVTLRYGGIEVDRGSAPDSTLAERAAFVYDERISPEIGSQGGAWIIAFGRDTTGYSFEDSNLKLRRILTDPSTDNGNLTLIATGTGVVSVTGTTNYEDQVITFGDDALTNKKYVDDAILNNPTFQIRAPQNQDTRVIIADKDVVFPAGTPGSIAYHIEETNFVPRGLESVVTLVVDGARTAHFYKDEIILQNLIVKTNQISAEQDIDVFVNTSGTGSLRINKSLKIDNTIGNNPNPVNNSSIIYAKPKNIGNTGLYFVSNDTTSGTNEDELISKNRALVFSMLF
jgi:hypothetical protein